MAWKVLGTKRLFDNPWLTVRQDDVGLPNGQRIEDYFVLEYPDWCHVLALTPDNDVVLVKQYRHPLEEDSLELPGGVVDETGDRQAAALSAVKRELLEETGYGGGMFKHLASLSPNPATHNNLMHSFIATDVKLQASQSLDATEEIEVVLKPLAEFIDLAAQGKIMQTMQVSTLFLALHQLGMIEKYLENKKLENGKIL